MVVVMGPEGSRPGCSARTETLLIRYRVVKFKAF
jgi:hypothetical protein